jgi:hypothetical protein
MKVLRAGAAFLFGVLVLAACGSSNGDAETASEPSTRFKDQAIAVVPFDSQNPACMANPTAMDRHTLATCLRMDEAKLPTDYQVTTDFDAFAPEKKNASIFVMAGIEACPAPWFAFIGLGQVPVKDQPLVRPQNDPQLIAAGAAGGVTLIEGAGLVLGGVAASEILVPLAIGAAVVGGTVYLINHAEDIKDGTKQLVDKVSEMFKRRNPCPGGYFCGAGSTGGCGGRLSGAPCMFADAYGTTYGSESGFCGGVRSFSSAPDGKCWAPCVCRDAYPNAPNRRRW